jgi:hypothetical protein
MAFTLNGFGTTYHGTRWLPDGTYITTKWFTFLFVPIIPVKSVRVLKAGPMAGYWAASSQPLTVQDVPLDKEMVLKAYLWLVLAFGGLYAVGTAGNWLAEKL